MLHQSPPGSTGDDRPDIEYGPRGGRLRAAALRIDTRGADDPVDLVYSALQKNIATMLQDMQFKARRDGYSLTAPVITTDDAGEDITYTITAEGFPKEN